MSLEHKEPRLSVNQICKYIMARPGKGVGILKDAKYPPSYKGAYYRDASKGISLHLVNLPPNFKDLENIVKSLEQQPPTSDNDKARLINNIQALEKFMLMFDSLDWETYSVTLGEHAPPHISFHGVSISVRPDLILTQEKRGKKSVGGVKLHFSKTMALEEESAGYISACMQVFAENHLYQQGQPDHKLCYVLDIPSETAYQSPKAIKRRIQDIEAACQNIALVWPTIQP